MLVFCVLSFLLTWQVTLALETNWGIFGFPRGCFCRCGVPRSSLDNNLEGGRFTLPNEFPWLASINIGSKSLTGSLISDLHVITAASPLYGLTPDKLIITLGAHDRCNTYNTGLNVSVESVTLHPGYSTTNLNNDIALLKLRHKVAFSQYVAPICMPMFDSRDFEQVTWTAGWTNGSCSPQVSVLPTLPASTCVKGVPDVALWTQDKGCLGPLGTRSGVCKMDVGSPVMTRWTSLSSLRLIGVVSSSSCNFTSPTLYTRVINHADWINDQIRSECTCL